jgi:hypothetical protein
MSNRTGNHQPTARATPALRSLKLSWGRRDDAPDQQHTRRIRTHEQLASALDEIHAMAVQRHLAQLINVWVEEAEPGQDGTSLAWRPRLAPSTGPDDIVSDLPEPFIEAIIGDADRAGLRWLAADEQVQAIDPELSELHDLEFDNGGAVDLLPASVFRLHVDHVQNILKGLLDEGRRSDTFTWNELTFSEDED